MNRISPMILAVALFMEQMDSTVIATSLPAIATDLGVNPITLKLAVTTYLVAIGVFVPLSGWFADRFGAKRVFRAAILVFVTGSICCAIAGNLTEFVLARFLQGMGGAMMTPIGRVVLLRTTERSQLVSAMAFLTIPALIGPMIGPPLGGFITTWFSWHWIFLINVPVGIVGIILVTVFLPEIPSEHPGKLDFTGFFLMAIGASGCVFGLSVISLPALPPAIGISATLCGIIATALYIRHARRHPRPILDLGIFRDEAFRSSAIGGFIFRISIGAIPFLTALMLQMAFGLNPFETGMITFAGAIGAISTKFFAQRLYAWTGFRTALLVAATISTFATLTFAFFSPATPGWMLMLALLIGGISRSLFFTGVNALGFANVDNAAASHAATMNSVLQQVSIALGVAVAAAILETSTAIHGGGLQLGDFHLAFVAISVITILAAIPFIRMSNAVGAHVSGHH
jgi:EmrB/QacA subfamily drug resistance transporter